MTNPTPNNGDLRERVATILATRPVYLDTETTGLEYSSEVCEIAILDADGQVLLDTLVRPARRILAEATAVHGIDDAAVANAPTFDEVLPALRAYLDGQPLVIYNAAFDLRLLAQSARAAGVALRDNPGVWFHPSAIHCAMLLYAEHAGEWDEYHGNYRWQALGKAAAREQLILPPDLHRARADAELTRLLLERLAQRDPDAAG